jgi:hypothetical protein
VRAIRMDRATDCGHGALVPMAERDGMHWRGCVCSAVGPLSSSQAKAGGAEESNGEQEESAHFLKRPHQPPSRSYPWRTIAERSRIQQPSPAIAPCSPEQLGKSLRDRGCGASNYDRVPDVAPKCVQWLPPRLWTSSAGCGSQRRCERRLLDWLRRVIVMVTPRCPIIEALDDSAEAVVD